MDAERETSGRRCQAPGCPTTLSAYNSDYLCFAHADEVSRARFDRRYTKQDRPALYRPSAEPRAHARSASV